MFVIKGNEITMTRGDTIRIQVDITKDDEPYTPVDGDSVRFALKHKEMSQDSDGYSEFVDAEPLVVKTIPIDTMLLELEPNDTKGLSFGQYRYDIEITFSDGTVDTFIANAKFKVEPEVH